MTKVILVNEQDESIGTMEKLRAHEKGALHRAFSVFIFFRTKQGLELLLQRRHADKYHCGGLWTNTCCSHPHPGEKLETAAHRRLIEEMGLTISVKHAGQFIYRAEFENGLVEHELDHVFVGYTEEKNIQVNRNEVDAYRWVFIADLEKDLSENPKQFTPWLKPALEIALDFSS